MSNNTTVAALPVPTVDWREAEIGDFVVMKTCNCGCTLMREFMVFEKVGDPLPPDRKKQVYVRIS